MKARGGTSVSRPVISAGPHVAILVRIIDMGSQYVKNAYGEGWKPQLKFVFELPFELHQYNDGEEEKPAWLWAKYNNIISDNSLLHKFITGAIGRKLNKSEYSTFDIGQFLGKKFIVQVGHTQKSDGNGVWENVNSAIMVTPELQNNAMYKGVPWDQAVPKNDVYGFAIDDAGECFKSPLFGEFKPSPNPDRKGLREQILDSKEGRAFLEAGGKPYLKPEETEEAPQAPKEEAPTNPLGGGNDLTEGAGNIPSPGSFM
jgi:hypothetical protein